MVQQAENDGGDTAGRERDGDSDAASQERRRRHGRPEMGSTELLRAGRRRANLEL